MKLNFLNSAGLSRTLVLAGLLWAPMMGVAADSIFINTGTINNNNLPTVDATNFVNKGSWYIYTAVPYQTSDTLNYTNTGTMVGSVGWEFDHGPVPPLGGRDWSANFANNSASATIWAVDSDTANPFHYDYPQSHLWINATNIVNKGTLEADANGDIVINGGTVNLAYSQLMINPPATGGGFVGGVNGTNFALDTGLYAETWAQSNAMMDVRSRWDGTNVNVLLNDFVVQDNCSTNAYHPQNDFEFPWPANALTFTPTRLDSTNLVFQGLVTYTNASGQTATEMEPTNEFRQAVFVLTDSRNSNVTAQIRFTPSSDPTNYFQTVAVQLAATLTNAFTLSLQTNFIYVVNTLASETNRGFYVNTNISTFYTCPGSILQPADYIVSRSDPILAQTGQPAFGSGVSGAGAPPPDFYYSTNLANATLTNQYSAYSVYVDDLAANPVYAAATNLPGRIEINANNLDLSGTWLGAQGFLSIQASNLVGIAGAVVDCQNLSFNFSSTNGNFDIANLTQPEVSRLRGPIYAFSAIWTNQMPIFIQSYDTNGNPTPFFVTNQVASSILVVNAAGLVTHVPVTVQDLALHSTNNITISDSVTVSNSFLLDGTSFTLQGDLVLTNGVQNWTVATAPHLLYFTNNGYLYIPNQALFGDTSAPYQEFVNNGQMRVDGGITLNSIDFQNNAINGGSSDNISTPFGSFSATVQTAEMTGGIYPASIYAGSDIQLNAGTLQMNDVFLEAYGALGFNVTANLSDDGASDTFYCAGGFNLWTSPQFGDLSHSTIYSFGFQDHVRIDHAWAGVDYGQTNWLPAFANNAPIGTLVIWPENPHPNAPPKFRFYGTGGAPSNAMYVATLDFSHITNAATFPSMIQIDPGMKIYFSQVLLGFTPPNGQTPAEYLHSLSFYPGQSGQFVKMPNVVAAQSGSVDWNTTYQPIDGFGASSAWRPTWTTAQADMFFSTNNGVGLSYNGTNFSFTGIGLSLLRNHIYPAGYPNTTTSPIAVPQTSETNIMLMAQARGAKIWSTPWTPPVGFKQINDIYDTNSATAGGLFGGHFVGTNDNYDAYANQLANYVVSMKNLGINLYAISIQNEPDANVTNYEACQWTGQEIHDFVPYLYQYLQIDGVGTTKIMLPESQNWPDYRNLAGPSLTDFNVLPDVGIVADHNYDSPPYTLAKYSYGKPLWETEVATFDPYDGGINNGIYWAKRIYNFLTQAQVNAWNYWWLIPSGPDNEGLTDTNGVPARRMYVLGQFSRFVRPGFVRIGVNAPSGSTNLLITAFRATNSQNFAIVAINPNVNIDLTNTFSLANFPAVSAVTPWMTSSSNSLTQMPDVPVSGSSFTYFIPAQSVVTFVNQGYGGGASSVGNPTNIVISSTAYRASGHSFVLTWNATPGTTYSVFKTSTLGGSPTAWSAIVTGYPAGGAAGGSLSYTDTTATATGPAFYRIMAEQTQ